MKRFLFGLAAVVFGAGLALLAAELAVRRQAEGSWSAVLQSLGAATPTEITTGSWITADPDLGYRLDPSTGEINAWGFRGPEVEATPPADRARILVLGDSIAWPPQGFVGMVAERLGDRAEVLNASVPGYTTYQERVFFEKRLSGLKPDLTLIVHCLNDHHRFLHRFDAQARMLATEEGRRALLPEGEGLLADLSRRSYLLLRIRLLAARVFADADRRTWSADAAFAPAWRPQPWETFAEHLAALKGAVAEFGGGIAVVLAPYGPQFDSSLPGTDRDQTFFPQRAMGQVCRRLDVPLLDLTDPIGKSGGEKLFSDGIHFTDDGHRVAAEEITRWIETLPALSNVRRP